MKKKVRPRSSQSEKVAHSKELTRSKKVNRSKKVTGTQEATQVEEVTTIEEATQTEEITVTEEVTQTEKMAQTEEMVQTEEMEPPTLNVVVTHSERQGGFRRSDWDLWVWPRVVLGKENMGMFWLKAGVRTYFRVAGLLCPRTLIGSSKWK